MMMACFSAVVGIMMCSSQIRIRHYYRRSTGSLPLMDECPWARVLACQDSNAMLELTVLHFEGFNVLLEWFGPAIQDLWASRKGQGETRGRKRIMVPCDVLGMCMAYMHLVVECSSLCLLFSLTPSSVSRYLSGGMGVLLSVLRACPIAKNQMAVMVVVKSLLSGSHHAAAVEIAICHAAGS